MAGVRMAVVVSVLPALLFFMVVATTTPVLLFMMMATSCASDPEPTTSDLFIHPKCLNKTTSITGNSYFTSLVRLRCDSCTGPVVDPANFASAMVVPVLTAFGVLSAMLEYDRYVTTYNAQRRTMQMRMLCIATYYSFLILVVLY